MAGVAVAWLLAFFAQFLFDRFGDLPAWLAGDVSIISIGAMLLVAAGILFAVAAPRAAARTCSRELTGVDGEIGPHWPSTRVSMWLFGAGMLAYLLAITLALFQVETALVTWLWLAAPLLLGAGLWRRGDFGLLLSQLRDQHRIILLLVLILAVALFLRLYQLESVPQDIHGDMASHGFQAREILKGTTGGIIGFGWAGIPLSGFLPTASMMALTGDQGLIGLRLPSVIGGLLSIVGLFVLLLQVSTPRVAILASALLAISYAHVHFSRIAEYMDPVPLAVWMFAFMLLGLRLGRLFAMLLAGVLLAFSTLGYFAGRATPFLLLLFLLYLFLVDRQCLRANRRGLVVLALGFLVGLGPMAFEFARHAEQIWFRVGEVFLFNPEVIDHLANKYGLTSGWSVLLEQTQRSLLIFNVYGDSSTQFGFPRPLFDSVSAPLLVLGLAYALAHLRDWANGLLALAVLSLLLVGILTNNAAFWPRLVSILLPAAALAALAIDRSWQSLVDATGDETNRFLVLIATVGLIYLAVVNVLLYYPFARSNGRPRAIVGRTVASLPADATVCLVSEDPADSFTWIHSVEEREIAYFMGSRLGIDIDVPSRPIADHSPVECQRSGAVWIVPLRHDVIVRDLREAFPGGRVTAHGPKKGDVVFYAFELP
ncbi:MAG: glycosyltransferase family 39 protein [Chloroflexota bacterium]|nr:glycosyltransferase family 39 protein [Chloroflexota bacterium]